MAPRSPITATPDDWQRAGAAVKARRLELGLTQGEAVARSNGGISLAVWSILENARQENGAMGMAQLAAASRSLGWVPDSIERILAGHPPDEATPQHVIDQDEPAITTAGRSGATLEDLEAVDPEAAAKVRADIEFYLRRAEERR